MTNEDIIGDEGIAPEKKKTNVDVPPGISARSESNGVLANQMATTGDQRYKNESSVYPHPS